MHGITTIINDMILKDFKLEEIGPGQKIRLSCRLVKKWNGKWRAVNFQRELDLDQQQRIDYPRIYMEFVQISLQELERIDDVYIPVDESAGFKNYRGDPLYDVVVEW